jgi:V8-like Glu-specific endopeptidase
MLLLSRPTFLALVLLVVMAAPVGAARPSAAALARAEQDRIVRYWTPERMAAAQPRDFVLTGSGFVPAAKPPGTPGGPGGGGGGGDGSTVTGASWTKGGDVVDGVGKAFFTMGSSAYTCSGSVAQDSRSGYSLVLTAGHCVYDETNGRFATNWIFIPAWGTSPTGFSGTNCSTYSGTAYGCWSASALVVHSGYATAGGFNEQATVHDFGFAIVGAGGHSGTQLDATVPDFALGVGSISRGERVYAFGYPAAQKYKGNTLSYCAGNTIEDGWNDNQTWGLACDMTGGSSGGAWFADFNETTGAGTLGSLNSYGYSGVKNMYGPKFNSDTQDVYSTANNNGTTSNTIVP